MTFLIGLGAGLIGGQILVWSMFVGCIYAGERGVTTMTYPLHVEQELADHIAAAIDAEAAEDAARVRFERTNNEADYYDLDMAVRLAAGARSRLRCFRSDLDVLAIPSNAAAAARRYFYAGQKFDRDHSGPDGL